MHKNRNNLCVGKVSGGSKTNPLWVSKVDDKRFNAALTASLKNAGFISASPQYRLEAKLQVLAQPFMGANLRGTALIDYHIYDIKSGKQVFDETIDSEFTSKLNDALMEATRLKIANEDAIRCNIEQLIKKLNKVTH